MVLGWRASITLNYQNFNDYYIKFYINYYYNLSEGNTITK
jgi:hypothetical protein